MKLYHYNTQKLGVLKTPRQLYKENPTKEIKERIDDYDKRFKENTRVVSYADNISFFFEPIPSKTLAEIYGSNHPVWFKGNVLYEHVLDTSSFPINFYFEIVETVEEVRFLDKFVEDNNWISDNPRLLKKYLKESREQKFERNELGNGIKDLVEYSVGHNTGIQLAYLNLPKRKDFEENRNKYAPCVPHVMCYMLGQEPLNVAETFVLKIGSDKRLKVS